MDQPILRAEHEEFKRRIEEKDKRQDKRLDVIEEDVGNLKDLYVTIKELAVNMQNMYQEQIRQGKHMEKQDTRIEYLENRDGYMWREAIKTFIAAVVSGIVGIIIGSYI